MLAAGARSRARPASERRPAPLNSVSNCCWHRGGGQKGQSRPQSRQLPRRHDADTPTSPCSLVDCGNEAVKLARGSCSALGGMFFQSVGGAAAYGDAKECSALTAGLDGMLKGTTIPDACCR